MSRISSTRVGSGKRSTLLLPGMTPMVAGVATVDRVSTVDQTSSLAYREAQGRWVLAATVLGTGMAFLDATVVNVALPAIGRIIQAATDAVGSARQVVARAERQLLLDHARRHGQAAWSPLA